MPLKRRNGKRRLLPQDEMELWSAVFWRGHDIFNEHDFRTNEETRLAAREPWARVGRLFLEEEVRVSIWREPPWALTTFGEPPCR